MPLIVMVGPNAIGKTTAAARWYESYPSLVSVSCDNGLVRANGLSNVIPRDREKGWSGSVEEKTALVRKYRDLERVVLIESARTDIVRFAEGEGWLLVVTCNGPTHKRHLQARCEAKRKRFREDYWTDQKLTYESFGRYNNAANRYWDCAKTERFVVEDQETDWARIDDWFGTLFRKLHNGLIRNSGSSSDSIG